VRFSILFLFLPFTSPLLPHHPFHQQLLLLLPSLLLPCHAKRCTVLHLIAMGNEIFGLMIPSG